MASRFPKLSGFDYCLNPLHIVQDEKDVIVPCGKCDGCRIHSANEWSLRLSAEIDSNPYSVFCTYTYSNDFLPTLEPYVESLGTVVWNSQHCHNWRFANTRCSLRDDNIVIDGSYDSVPVTNYPRDYVIPYLSKRDIQLYLKQLRKDIISYGFEKSSLRGGEPYYFKYFIIGEYGSTLYRSHFHAIFFPSSKELQQAFLDGLLYAPWSMCDKDRFQHNCVPCNSGASSYLTQYVNSLVVLPKVFTEKEIRPFRLSSKSPAIGYSSFNRKEIFEDISQGIVEYRRVISRCEDEYVLRFPKNYLSTIFPKCARYSEKSFSELLFVYGAYYRLAQQSCGESDSFVRRLSESLCPSDYEASRVCNKICLEYGFTPFHYLFLLDMYYYKSDMYALELFYTFQQKHYTESFVLYNNISDYIHRIRLGSASNLEILSFDMFCGSFGVDMLRYVSKSAKLSAPVSRPTSNYIAEVEDILNNMVKMPKFNEALGISPNSTF